MDQQFFSRHTVPEYRKKQLNHAIYQEFIASFSELTTWPTELRNALVYEVPLSTIRLVTKQVSKDKGTEKLLFERRDGKQFETVVMRHTDGRNTVCVSSMIGCPVGCTFCATGQMGFLGNLKSEEIVDQVLFVARELKKESQTVTNVVFMGMGEPLLNLESVENAIACMTDKDRMAMSERRITVSTSGHIDHLKQLLHHGYTGRLALSLHAPNQQLRERLIPIAKTNPLDELLRVLHDHAKKTNKRISYEYILIDKVNDSKSHARELGKLIGVHLTHVNLIPYNPVSGVSFVRSTPEAIRAFSTVLKQMGISHTIRVTMGDDIAAACGQLAGRMV